MSISFVTGASRGLGLELTKQLLSGGGKVIATCRDPSKLNLPTNPNLTVIPLDVTNEVQIKELGERVKPLLSDSGLDLLFNNAGVQLNNQALSKHTREDLLQTLEVNVIGPILITTALLPFLKKRGKSSALFKSHPLIVNMSTDVASFSSNLPAVVTGYRVSKCSLNYVTKLWGKELSNSGVRVVSLMPGWVDTEMGRKMGKPPLSPTDSVTSMLKTIELVRALEFEMKENCAFIDWKGKALSW